MDEEIIGMVGLMSVCFVIIAMVVGFCSTPSIPSPPDLRSAEQRFRRIQQMQNYSGDYSYVENPYE